MIRKAKKNEFPQVIVLAKRKTKQVFQTMISGSICLRQLRYPNLALSVILIHEHILNLFTHHCYKTTAHVKLINTHITNNQDLISENEGGRERERERLKYKKIPSYAQETFSIKISAVKNSKLYYENTALQHSLP